MVNNLSLSTLISQLPEAQRLHQVQLSHPENQHALAQELSLRRQEQEKSQVAKSENIANQVVDKDGHQGTGSYDHGGGRSKEEQEGESLPDQDRLLDVIA